MSDDNFLTIGEFERTMKPLRELIEQGFRLTHLKQDTTNGRVTVNEKAIEVLSKSRLIDRTDRIEADVQSLTERATREDEADRTTGQRWTTASVALLTVSASLGGGFGSALLVAFLKAKFGW